MRASGSLGGGKSVDRHQTPALEEPLGAGRIHFRDARSRKKRERGARPAMDELGAELHRSREAGHAPGPATAADPAPRLEHEDGGSGAPERVGGRKARRARPDDDYVVRDFTPA